MDNDNKKTIWIVSLFVLAFATLVLSVTWYNVNQNNNVAQMIKDGVDPLLIPCVNTYSAPVCIATAARR